MQSQRILLSNKSEGEKQFPISEIVFCQSDNNKVMFWFRDCSCFVVTGSLSAFEKMLTPYGFYRLQQSYLLNINHVDAVKRSEKDVIMKNYPKLEISASRNSHRWESFIEAWEEKAIWPEKNGML